MVQERAHYAPHIVDNVQTAALASVMHAMLDIIYYKIKHVQPAVYSIVKLALTTCAHPVKPDTPWTLPHLHGNAWPVQLTAPSAM
jgi:hypothetical protein